MKRTNRSGRTAGFALIEVLVTLVVLLIGLVGLMGLSARANISEMESYQRDQAMILLQDMVDRLNANRGVAPCYANSVTTSLSTVQVGTSPSNVPTSCTQAVDQNGSAVAASQQTQAIADLTAWDSAINGSAELSGTNKVGAMIGAVGCVRQLDATNRIYLVSVAWQGLSDTAAPTDAAGAAATCGYNLYGAETRHRMVTATVQIAKLT